MSIEANTGIDYGDELESINLELWSLKEQLNNGCENSDKSDLELIQELDKAAEQITGVKHKWSYSFEKWNVDYKKIVCQRVYEVCGISNTLSKNTISQNIIKGAIDRAVQVPSELIKKFRKAPAKCLLAIYKLVYDTKNTLIEKVITTFWRLSLKTPFSQYLTWRKAVWIIVNLLDL